MINFFKTKKILFFILVLAAFLRLWNLGNVPPSSSMDEASIGYNAYSVLKTGGDEYGEFPLISQRSYDDWRRSTYLLLVVPFINVFGLSVVAVRLPAVILSILTVWVTYRIVLLLFSKTSPFATIAALTIAFLLAISPWHIYISRLGHESNACLSFLILGVLFFLQGLKEKNRLILAMLFFILSMISYYSGQVFIPLFGIGLLVIFGKKLLSIALSSKKMLFSFLIFSALLIPIFWTIFSPQALIRFRGTSTFNPQVHSELFYERVISWNKAVENKDIFGMVFYHRYLFPVVVFTQGYLSHFNPKWLFTNSSQESFKVPNLGLINIWEVPLIFIGIFILIFNKLIDSKNKKLILLWFLLAAIPGSIATQAPHAMRFYNALPTWQIFSALGLVYLFYKFKKYNIWTVSVFFFIFLISVFNFYMNYFIIFPKTQSSSFEYALSKAIPFVLERKNLYKKIVFSNKDNLYQSYMLLLFHSRYEPSLYQKQGGTVSGGFAEIHAFDRYEFRPIDWGKEIKNNNTLYLGNTSEAPVDIIPIASFYNLDNKRAIVVWEDKYEGK